MTNEAVLLIETQSPIPFTVADTLAAEKGALLALEDPFTASGSVAISPFMSGVTASEKIASDGKTKLGVYRQGYFKFVASGAIKIGRAFSFAGGSANEVMEAPVSVSGAGILGHSMEEAGDTDSFVGYLGVGSGGNAIS